MECNVGKKGKRKGSWKGSWKGEKGKEKEEEEGDVVRREGSCGCRLIRKGMELDNNWKYWKDVHQKCQTDCYPDISSFG